jgi:DDE superfamily endonuclease
MNIQEAIVQLKQFRQELHEAFDHRADALMELLDALSSTPDARSVAELSLSPFFRRGYGSAYDAIAHLFQASDPETAEEERRAWEQKLLRLKVPYLSPPQQRKFWLLGTDAVSIARLFAPTLEDRGYVYQPNVPRGNKPITIGHQYSAQVIYPEKDLSSDPSWVLPLSTRRIHSEETATAVGQEQIEALMGDETLPFREELCVHVADSTYSAVLFLGATEKHKNLVNVVRSRSNRVFYRQPLPVEGKRKPGRPPWYGEPFSLKDPTTWGDPDAVEETILTTRKGQTHRVQLEGWHDLLMRGKKDLPMQQKPFTLIRVRVLDERGQPIFQHTLWLIVIGQRRQELSLLEAWEAYGQRFDVEHYFRFGKQRLLMATFQTPDVSHEENWLEFVSLAYVQLWLAREVAEALPRPWEQYLPQSEGPVASPSAAQRDFGRILREIGTPAQPPKPRGNSPGRAKGTRLARRKRHRVIKKGKKTRKTTSNST